MFSWPMITGVLDGGVLYSFTSVPQIPATSIFMSALSSGMSGMGNSRISVLPGPVLTAANTLSTRVPQKMTVDPHFLTRCMRAPIHRTCSAARDGNSAIIGIGQANLEKPHVEPKSRRFAQIGRPGLGRADRGLGRGEPRPRRPGRRRRLRPRLDSPSPRARALPDGVLDRPCIGDAR